MSQGDDACVRCCMPATHENSHQGHCFACWNFRPNRAGQSRNECTPSPSTSKPEWNVLKLTSSQVDETGVFPENIGFSVCAQTCRLSPVAALLTAYSASHFCVLPSPVLPTKANDHGSYGNKQSARDDTHQGFGKNNRQDAKQGIDIRRRLIPANFQIHTRLRCSTFRFQWEMLSQTCRTESKTPHDSCFGSIASAFLI